MSISETAAKKDTQKLQRAIVDGLEDVKAQDIRVFNTEHISALFERVVVASGTSNRQTKALAASVIDAVRDAGFPKPRIEGEENGEWIIVDCGAAVVHIMQPAIRQYYQLEEIWGEKPVRLKFGAPKPVTAAPKAVAKPAGKSAAKAGSKTAAKPAAKPEKGAAKTAARTAAAPAKTAGRAAGAAGGQAPARAPAKAPGSKAPVKASAKTAGKAPAKAAAKVAGKAPAKKPASAAAPSRSRMA